MNKFNFTIFQINLNCLTNLNFNPRQQAKIMFSVKIFCTYILILFMGSNI